MGDSPFQDSTVPPLVELGVDTETDIYVTRLELESVTGRLREAVTIVRGNPGIAGNFKSFGDDDVGFLCRIITRLESAASELIAAGY
jgi:hypothetical protein